MTLIYLLIEFLDELTFGVSETAWPMIRDDLGLTYAQIGLALSLPGLVANLIEPFIGILGDVWKRRTLILGGGLFFALALFMTAISWNFVFFILAVTLFHPSSGAFVSLSQATLMDSTPERREQNIARWTFAGSLGVFVGPLILGSAAFLGFGWRGVFAALGVLTIFALTIIWRRIPMDGDDHPPLPRFTDLLSGLRSTFQALRDKETLRWLVLLEFSDLMLDVLYSFLALYFVDVGRLTPVQAAASVAVWTGFGLLGDFLLIPLLEKVRGLNYLRLSVTLELLLFPAFLLTSHLALKLVLLALLGLFNSGWYAILKGKLYDSMPAGLSSTVMSVGTLSGMLGKLLPLGIGLAAQAFGLAAAMWLLLAGPLALLIGLPRGNSPRISGGDEGVISA